MTSKRINAIISAIEKCETLADVGCDHGYIGAGVLRQKKADHVYFCDISEKCLLKAKRHCEELFQGFCDCSAETTEARANPTFSFHAMDGLGSINPDTAVIAGMGGMEIISILSKATPPETLVLQPAKNARELRRYLSGNYDFLYEAIVHDAKFYPLMVLRRSKAPKPLSDAQSFFGINPKIDMDYMAFIQYRYKEIRAILERGSPPALVSEKELIETYFKYVINDL